MNNSVNFNITTPQINFGCKKVNKKILNKVFFSNEEKELISRGRNIYEKEEILKRESAGKVLKIFKSFFK